MPRHLFCLFGQLGLDVHLAPPQQVRRDQVSQHHSTLVRSGHLPPVTAVSAKVQDAQLRAASASTSADPAAEASAKQEQQEVKYGVVQLHLN